MLEFDTMEQFNIWHEEVNTYFGYPSTNGTLQYTSCVAGINGKIYAPYDYKLPANFIGIVVENPPLQQEE